jgi:hypothetical protein
MITPSCEKSTREDGILPPPPPPFTHTHTPTRFNRYFLAKILIWTLESLNINDFPTCRPFQFQSFDVNKPREGWWLLQKVKVFFIGRRQNSKLKLVKCKKWIVIVNVHFRQRKWTMLTIFMASHWWFNYLIITLIWKPMRVFKLKFNWENSEWSEQVGIKDGVLPCWYLIGYEIN